MNGKRRGGEHPMDRPIKANGKTLTQGMVSQPWQLDEHLAQLAARYGVKPRGVSAPELTPTDTLPGRPSLAAVGSCASCGRTLVSATRQRIGDRALCGRCYDWPGDHAEWVARRRREL